MSIGETDNAQRKRSVCQHNIKHGDILTNPARKSVKPGLMIRKANDNFGGEYARCNQGFDAFAPGLAHGMRGLVTVNLKECLQHCL